MSTETTRLITDRPQRELNGQLFNYKQNTKFWGVYLSTRLIWRLHTENLITKARKQLNFTHKIVQWCKYTISVVIKNAL